MSPNQSLKEIDEATEVRVRNAGQFTEEELEWLNGVVFNGYDLNGDHVDEVGIMFDKLAEIAFEYDLLDSVASHVEVEVLRYFRNSHQDTHTTAEVSKETNRAKSSVSRALGSLVEKDRLTKIQQGVYRLAE